MKDWILPIGFQTGVAPELKHHITVSIFKNKTKHCIIFLPCGMPPLQIFWQYSLGKARYWSVHCLQLPILLCSSGSVLHCSAVGRGWSWPTFSVVFDNITWLTAMLIVRLPSEQKNDSLGSEIQRPFWKAATRLRVQSSYQYVLEK